MPRKTLQRKSKHKTRKMPERHFAKIKIKLLGFEISQQGIKPLVSKTDALQSLKARKTANNLTHS